MRVVSLTDRRKYGRSGFVEWVAANLILSGPQSKTEGVKNGRRRPNDAPTAITHEGAVGKVKLFSMFSRPAEWKPATGLYRAIVAQARTPLFYRSFDVPDTPDGRFDMILIHMFLVIDRLNAETGGAAALAQALYDVMFDDMDRNLREMGVGDVGVPIRIRKMTEGFQGRMAAYEAALKEAGDDRLIDVLDRNVYQQATPKPLALAAMAHYIRAQRAVLAPQALDDLKAGKVRFEPPHPPAAEPGDPRS